METSLRCQSVEIIARAIGRPRSVFYVPGSGHTFCFSRWYYLGGPYVVEALPSPLLALNLARTPTGRYRTVTGGWSDDPLIPGTLTSLEAGMPSEWRIDGELHTLVLCLAEQGPSGDPAEHSTTTFWRYPIFNAGMHFLEDPFLATLLRRIVDYLEWAEPADATYMRALTQALEAHLAVTELNPEPAGTSPASGGPRQAIYAAIRMIESHGAAHVGIEELAAAAGLAPDYFSRVFKQATGYSPQQYLLAMRIERARELLISTTMAIAQIAEVTGFSTQSHFTNAFRERVGTPPGSYRKQAHQHGGTDLPITSRRQR